jgi:hypothetical protein
MKLQVVQDTDTDALRPANEQGAYGEALDSVLSFSVSDAGFVVFEQGALWPQALGSDLAGRLGVTVIVQQPGESHDQLLKRVRHRATRLQEPVGQLVWVGSVETQVHWAELLHALFASNEFGPQCSFSVYSGSSDAVLAFEELGFEEPAGAVSAPPWSVVRSTKQAGVAESA